MRSSLHQKSQLFLPCQKQSNKETSLALSEINNLGFNKEIFARGEIVFDNVSVCYPDCTDLALQNINLVVRPGQKLGVVGKTGSGKSTLVKLLMQYVQPVAGRVMIDGYDISKIDVKQLRSEFMVVN